MNYTAQVKNGKIQVEELTPFYQNLKKLEGSRITISIDKKTDKPRRKALLDMYYHTIVVPRIQEAMREAGLKIMVNGKANDPTREDVHEYLKMIHNGRYVEIRPGFYSEVFGSSTKKLTIEQMEKYLYNIRKWAYSIFKLDLPELEPETIIQYGKDS